MLIGFFNLICPILERFSNDCRKTKTKAITLTNYNRSRQRDEPINADFRSFMDLHQPDILLGCESKLDGEPTYSVFPANYTVYRTDRNSHGCGVFIAIKDIYPSYPLYPSTANCEIVWASLELQSHKKRLTGVILPTT